MKETIIYEDPHIVCLNKAATIAVQPDKTKDLSLLQMAEKHYNKKLYPINRIDRPASGIVLFAKNKKSANKFSQIFKNNNLTKKYLAIVEKKPQIATNTLEDYLIKKNNKAYISNNTRGKKAILKYKHIGSSIKYHFLDIELKTGRYHQIRCQLANIDCVIKGDVKYGARRKNKDRSICLHSYLLSFEHPFASETIMLKAELPDEILWNEAIIYL